VAGAYRARLHYPQGGERGLEAQLEDGGHLHRHIEG
jgi:hypothetical protein